MYQEKEREREREKEKEKYKHDNRLIHSEEYKISLYEIIKE